MADHQRLGLRLGLGAFLLLILSGLLPPLFVGYLLLGVAAMAALYRDGRHRGAAARKATTLGLVLVAGGMLVMVASNAMSARAFVAGDEDLRRAAAWLGAIGDATAAAGFYLGVGHLAAARSRLLLGVGFGAAVALALLNAATGGQAALAQGAPYIAYGWAYATILGRMREGEARDAAGQPGS